ncbi:MAG: sensor histidine kinase [Kiritimatiellia bacterium]
MSRIPLRRRYFRDVSRMGGLILLVCMVVLTGFNAVEFFEHRGEGSEELWEMVILFVALLATLPAVVWLAWRTSGRLLRPLQDIHSSVQEIRAGNLDRKVDAPEAEDELAYLAESLNAAFDAHRSAQQRLLQFSSDVSHQLRTPLTAMKTEGELALSRERSPEEYRETLGRVLEQADHLSRVVNQLLLLAKVSASAAEPEWERVDLAELSRELPFAFMAIMEDRGVDWRLEMGEEAWVISGNPWWLREAFLNLINNALQYTPDPAAIHLKLFRDGERICWRLEDSGPGIPPEQRERIFERFRRGNTSTDHGTGLGLAIVQEVMRLHQGELRLEESPLGGCSFSLYFPMKIPHQPHSIP